MTKEEKKEKLNELDSLLVKAHNIANELINQEKTHSKNQDMLYPIRQQLSSCLVRTEFIKY